MISSAQIMGIDNSHLCAVDDTHFLLPEVRDAFLKMQKSAKSAGLDMQICSSFRGFDKQLSIWNRKWLGQLPLYTLSGDTLDVGSLSEADKIHAIMLWSALPGASRHHWGTDFDYFDKTSVDLHGCRFELITDEYEPPGPCAELASWVRENAHHYGFYLPYSDYVGGVACEPWHLSYQNVAEQIQAQFDIEALSAKLNSSMILGKNAVLASLDYLVKRYTYNKGTQT